MPPPPNRGFEWNDSVAVFTKSRQNRSRRSASRRFEILGRPLIDLTLKRAARAGTVLTHTHKEMRRPLRRAPVAVAPPRALQHSQSGSCAKAGAHLANRASDRTRERER